MQLEVVFECIRQENLHAVLVTLWCKCTCGDKIGARHVESIWLRLQMIAAKATEGTLANPSWPLWPPSGPEVEPCPHHFGTVLSAQPTLSHLLGFHGPSSAGLPFCHWSIVTHLAQLSILTTVLVKFPTAALSTFKGDFFYLVWTEPKCTKQREESTIIKTTAVFRPPEAHFRSECTLKDEITWVVKPLPSPAAN